MAALVLCSCINTNVILKNHSSKRELGKNKENTKVENKRMESYRQREYNTTEQQNVLKKKMKKRTIIRPLVICLIVQIKTIYFHNPRIEISKDLFGEPTWALFLYSATTTWLQRRHLEIF